MAQGKKAKVREMTCTIVYRLECPAGQGPYNRLDGINSWDSNLLHDNTPPPTIEYWQEGDRDIFHLLADSNCVFGFASLEQLRRWFKRAGLRFLRERGLKLHTYMVPPGKVWRGKTQVLFDRSCAKLLTKGVRE